jgi:transcriptional regulator with XRE-family HTH domain
VKLLSDLKKQFGGKIKELRKQKGLKQAELAERIEVTVDFISLVERGIYAPSFKNIEKLADAFGVPVAELFTYE